MIDHLTVTLPHENDAPIWRLEIGILSAGSKPRLDCPGDEPEWEVLYAEGWHPSLERWVYIGSTVSLGRQIQEHQDHIHTAVCDHLTAQGLR